MGKVYSEDCGTCPRCGRLLATYVPSKGNGTCRYMYRHKSGPKLDKSVWTSSKDLNICSHVEWDWKAK